MASSPATTAVTAVRPLAPAASPTASTAGRTTAEACVIEAACVSSKSSPWASAPLTSAANGAGAARLAPTTVQAPPSRPHPSSAP